MSDRPGLLVLVAGTATEVGKTWVTAATAGLLGAQGRAVAARKPAQSFDPDDVAREVTDAHVLASATGEVPTTVCPPHRWYEVPMAPPMAADVLGRPVVLLADLVGEVVWPDGTEIGFVETAGGVRSPLATDGDAVDLARAIDPDVVVLVADAGLGVINAVRTTAAALDDRDVVVVLNRYDTDDDLQRRNEQWLRERDGFTVVTSAPALAALVEARWRAKVGA